MDRDKVASLGLDMAKVGSDLGVLVGGTGVNVLVGIGELVLVGVLVGVNVLVGGMGVNVLVGGIGVNVLVGTVVLVLVGVLVGGAGVEVAVAVPHRGCWNISAMPEVRTPVLHSNWVYQPAQCSTPTVPPLPLWSTVP